MDQPNPLTLHVDILPKGSIILWYGMAQYVPTGWAICDGRSGTPNLSGKFVRGSTTDSDHRTPGGRATISLTEQELPEHSHRGSVRLKENSQNFSGCKLMSPDAYDRFIKDGSNEGTVNLYDRGGHNGWARKVGEMVEHLEVAVDKTGKGKSFAIEPPYVNLYYIMRTE